MTQNFFSLFLCHGDCAGGKENKKMAHISDKN